VVNKLIYIIFLINISLYIDYIFCSDYTTLLATQLYYQQLHPLLVCFCVCIRLPDMRAG